ncbi:MAG: hypothetical protein UX09_C0030G0003 [Candidatus Uhrbacteria bacterium GW2011_GWE2_45_35]|uniref:YgjP-like metallopeptidase domain-containing protein n=1 Tax=Candidatus Uhrbacteria bacterium GW2011_GWE2_45_35 TaxID=1618993 RepID=A0A0G1MGN3_9BACT|nr:MAG: hypothetical protein UX09_C0030G0003 [Candidatus Uhrbacteria bacterium GW2011_GWE2_45_35]HBR80276.1 M48 family peptidase [Candidatus Uhrbacteria bacterium]HCU31736.1 M48 family peptidase [Candidatus Uhrbacteria bacterium]
MKIIRSNRRSICLEITPEAVLIVRVPERVPQSYIEKLVQEKADWIQKKIAAAKNRPRAQEKSFVDGEGFFFLGKSYPLKITRAKKIELTDELIFPEKFLPKAKNKLEVWYKQEARKIISARAEIFAEKMGLKFAAVKINSAQKRWGSCSRKNHLNFGWKLILQPLELVDYVIVHELAHIPHKNHSRVFWQLVAEYCPEFKVYRKRLREDRVCWF